MDIRQYLSNIEKELCIDYRIESKDLERIPQKGPVIAVMNHPFGGIEGIILSSLLRSLRSDVKIMANYLLEVIPDLADLFLFVDPFQGKDAKGRNLKALDLDAYDTFYLHLFPWKKDTQEIVGVYRIGPTDKALTRPEEWMVMASQILLKNIEEVSSWVAELEPDQKGVPVIKRSHNSFRLSVTDRIAFQLRDNKRRIE